MPVYDTAMSTSGRSQVPAAGERAYQWAKERILDGRLEGGQLLSEGEIATAVDVSRTPVREAFLRLEVEGLLRLYPKRGALVVPVSAGEVAEVSEARILLESHAAGKIIAAGRGGAVADELSEFLDEQRALDMPAQTARFSTVDRDFHAALVAAAGNGLVSQFYVGLRDRQVRISNTALHRVPSRHQEILDGHGQICQLLRAGEADQLEHLLASHIGSTHGAMLDT